MVGGVLIPSDLGLAHTNLRPPPLENTSIAVLPGGSSWYRWNTTTLVKGGQTIKETLQLSEMAVFIKAGAILPLQANGSIQHSGEAGGQLEVQVYGGEDGAFVMVEDDGITDDYATKNLTKTTTWKYDNGAMTLSYTVEGSFSGEGPGTYTHVVAVLLQDGKRIAAPSVKLQARGGKIVFK